METVAPHAGAWIETSSTSRLQGKENVAPHAGAWIETMARSDAYADSTVAPHAGAWIETSYSRQLPLIRGMRVAPHAGAWIETLTFELRGFLDLTSHPTRVRGLKPHAATAPDAVPAGRTPRGCVD